MKPQRYLVAYLGVILAVFVAALYIIPIITVWAFIGLIIAFLAALGLVLNYFRK